MASAVALSACASNYPNLMEGAAPPPAVGSAAGEIDLILAQAVKLQQSYGSGYKETAQWQDYSQLPLIGAAAWAAWVLLVDKASAARTAGKIGIGAAAYSTTRGQLTSAGLPDAYIAGHGALTCVLAEGSMFTGTGAQTQRTDLMTALSDVASQINDVNKERFTEPTEAPAQTAGTPAAAAIAAARAAQLENLRIARMLADTAIAAARTAQTDGFTELGEFRGAPSVFRNAVSSISVRVASKGRVRPAVDFATLRDKFAPAETKGDAADQQGDEGNDAASIIRRLNTKTQGLIDATADLIATTPNYGESLDRVRECPDMIK